MNENADTTKLALDQCPQYRISSNSELWPFPKIVFKSGGDDLVIEFIEATDLRHTEALVALMGALYTEDEAASPLDSSRFPLNVTQLAPGPSRGRVVLFHEDELIRGYALLSPHWSNEFGGNLLFIDQILVAPEVRGHGVGRRFLRFLEECRPFDAVALAVEVGTENTRVRRFYESLGFSVRPNDVLTRRLNEGAQE